LFVLLEVGFYDQKALAVEESAADPLTSGRRLTTGGTGAKKTPSSDELILPGAEIP
jgi:hypothetical protein